MINPVSILNQLCTLGGSGSSSAPSGAPARARVGEEDPAAIRLKFIYCFAFNSIMEIPSIWYYSNLQRNAEGKPRPDGNAEAKQPQTLWSSRKWGFGSLRQGSNPYLGACLRSRICAGVERTTGCEEGEGENENQVAFFKAFPFPIMCSMKWNFSGWWMLIHLTWRHRG